jgi:hypothetical protein
MASHQQTCHYLAGVGSDRGEGFETPGHLVEAGLQSEAAWVQRQVKNLYSGVTGWGTDFNIRAAYRWLVEHYDPGDAVFFFGFSRGAFAARSLAGFVDIVGVLFKHMQEHIVPLYDLYRQGPAGRRQLQDEVQKLAGRHGPFPRPGRSVGGRNGSDAPMNDPDALRVYFIGVWDTVGAIHSWQTIRSGRRRGSHEVEMPDNVTHVRHALALHELRAPFEPELFERAPTEPGGSLEQVWFAGAHADIGGGYPDESELAAVTLKWVAQEAADKGLVLDGLIERGFSATPGSTLARAHGVHNSLSGPFSLMIPRVRRMVGDPDPNTHPWAGRMRVHESAFERLLSGPPPSYCYVDGWVNQVLAEVDECSVRMAATMALLDGGRHADGPREPATLPKAERWWARIGLDELRNGLSTADNLDLRLSNSHEQGESSQWRAAAHTRALVWLLCPDRLAERLGGFKVEARHL